MRAIQKRTVFRKRQMVRNVEDADTASASGNGPKPTWRFALLGFGFQGGKQASEIQAIMSPFDPNVTRIIVEPQMLNSVFILTKGYRLNLDTAFPQRMRTVGQCEE